MYSVDSVVVGAGVVGIAIARALAMTGREVLVIERERHFGTATSSRNSEVVHAGIYYPRNSLKAQLCVEGRQQLYAFCEARSIPHRRCGKMIVATNGSQASQLDKIAAAAAGNGVGDLRALSAGEAMRLEPEIFCTAALLSPSTGIVDSHSLMLAMLGDAEENGATIAYATTVERIQQTPKGFAITVDADQEPMILARNVVNAAGLEATELAYKVAGLEARHVPTPYYAKGSYFALTGRSPFNRLIYPTPEPGGLGIHATLDIAGQVRFGPDVEWCDAIDYRLDEARSERFYEAIRTYWPGLRDGALRADYCGVRPKICGPGDPAADFVISGLEDHGLPGLVNLFGIESPGLTASLAIGELVAAMLAD